jgi:glutamate-1-semialdehyde 2,1-aminomutase
MIDGSGQRLYKRAKEIIPGGTQLLSKRPEMFLPEQWPAYYAKAKGCTIWDLDGRSYTDMSYMGIGACLLGYADDDVNSAVRSAVDNGSMATLNCPEEFELAELLTSSHGWADMVRYARTGAEGMSVAVRIARTCTGKDIVLFCGYHGWSDWYLSANLTDAAALDEQLIAGLDPAGVPRDLMHTAYPFHYNNTEEFKMLLEKHRGRIAAVVMEPVRNILPEEEFLRTIRDATTAENIVLVVDEITAGYRMTSGGTHLIYGFEPDIAVFAKGFSNGYPMAAVVGRRDVMDTAQRSFISSTYWTERIGPVAAIATIKKHEKLMAHEHLQRVGALVKKGWEEAAGSSGLDISLTGIDPLGHFDFAYDNPLVLKSIFIQEMLKRGFLATNAFYASLAHTDENVKSYTDAVHEVFTIISQAIANGNADTLLDGPVCHSGFERLN